MKQHKTLLLLAVLCLQFSSTSAQVSLGLRAGYFWHNFHFDPKPKDDFELKPFTGAQFSLPVEIGLSSHWAIQIEIMYGKHGANLKVLDELTINGILLTGEFTYDYRLNSLEFPLLAKWKLGKKRNWYLIAGPSIDILQNGKFNLKGSIYYLNPNGGGLELIPVDELYTARFVQNNFDPTLIEEDEFPSTKTNYNMHVGAGFSTKLGPCQLFFEGRYIALLTDFSPEPKDDPDSNDGKVKSYRWGGSLGILYPLQFSKKPNK